MINNNDVFWVNNPLILFDLNSFQDIWPNRHDSVNRKLNAVTRVIVLLNVIGLMVMYDRKWRLLLTTALTLVVILLYQRYDEREQTGVNPSLIQESFDNSQHYVQNRNAYKEPSVENPYMNVIHTEINDKPDTKPAAPTYNSSVKKDITDSIKSTLNEKIFRDLGDEIDFEVAQRQFYAMPNTTVPNDQKGFANFCYGNPATDKENGVTQYCK